MHIREPFVQVPDLPSSFLTNSQNEWRGGGGEFYGGVPSLFDMTGPRSRSTNDRAGLRTSSSSATNAASASSLSPRSRSRNRDMVSQMLSPTSHAYSEYQNVRRMRDYDDEEEEDDSSSPDRKPIQNTVFNHIDWSEFLVPGVPPPVPTSIPEAITH